MQRRVDAQQLLATRADGLVSRWVAVHGEQQNAGGGGASL